MKRNQEKKAYYSPKMEIVELQCSKRLMQGSDGYGSEKFSIFCKDCDD